MQLGSWKPLRNQLSSYTLSEGTLIWDSKYSLIGIYSMLRPDSFAQVNITIKFMFIIFTIGLGLGLGSRSDSGSAHTYYTTIIIIIIFFCKIVYNYFNGITTNINIRKI